MLFFYHVLLQHVDCTNQSHLARAMMSHNRKHAHLYVFKAVLQLHATIKTNYYKTLIKI